MIVTIIICTRNRAASLRDTLESLAFIQAPSGMRHEIVVVDNGSTDDTVEIVARQKFPNGAARRIFEPMAGLSNARNAGLFHARGEIILFTDDDLRFPGSWLETMCEPIIQKKADAVAGSIELDPQLARSWMTPMHRSLLASSERLESSEPSAMVGANMAFSKAVLDVVPGFDPELGAGALGLGEETLFALQLKKAGFKIGRSKGPAVSHCFGETRLCRSNWLRVAKNFGESEAYVDYHWYHRPIQTSSFLLIRKLAFYQIRRVLRWRECLSREGAPEWELKCLKGIHQLRRYLVECQRPRNYELEGLVKIRGLMPQQNRVQSMSAEVAVCLP